MTAVDPSAATAAEDARPAPAGAPGQSLGKYRLDRVIGSGGMGIVWAAFDPDLERAVALKLLRSADSEMTLRSRLLREARAMARLKHPSVLTVYEVGTDANRDYIAMELVDGDNLSDWLDAKPPRPEIVAALLAAGQGLAAAHAGGLVHRDFKPHNVLRSKDGHVYVTDFGLARGQIETDGELEQGAVHAFPEELATGSQPRRPRDSVLDSPLTQTGVMIGTPAYMAPEQFAGKVPDPRSDQFAFCVTAWEALTGARPFRGSTLEELEKAAGGGVRSIVVDLPPRIRAVIERGLDPDPAKRWPDMPALLAAFDAAIAMPPARSRRRTWIAASALAAVCAVAAAVSVVVTSRDRDDAESSAADCDSPETAFDGAWSPDKRNQLARGHQTPESIGAIMLLDELRRDWVRSYRTACTPPRTPARVAQLACLTQARGEAERLVKRLLHPKIVVNAKELGVLAVMLTKCEPDRELERERGKRLEQRVPSPPSPTPPTPPIPPVAPGASTLDIEIPEPEIDEPDTDTDHDSPSDDGEAAPPTPQQPPAPPRRRSGQRTPKE